MKESVFDKAKGLVCPKIIEAIVPGGSWAGEEYHVLNPMRNDTKLGSFSINETGQWHDFSSNAKIQDGDLITLICEVSGISKKEAAEKIIEIAGKTDGNNPTPNKKKKEKIKALVPVPEKSLKKLNFAAKSKWVTDKHGEPVKGWTYRTEDGGFYFSVTRHEKPDGSKSVLPWYFGVDEKWHMGQVATHGRPLFNLDKIKKDQKSKILITEGEKCASMDVPGYIVTTWPGGSSSVTKADWSPLDGRKIVIWRDNDTAGIKAAQEIKKRFPEAKVLQIPENKPRGWDLADPIAEGIAPDQFILYNMPMDIISSYDRHEIYIPLGYSKTTHYFMRKNCRAVFPITKGSFTQFKALEMADLETWAIYEDGVPYVTKDGGLKLANIYNDMVKASISAGRYNPRKIRGAGVWRDQDGIILNDGKNLIGPSGQVIKYNEYKTSNIYVESDVSFDSMTGDLSRDDDGRNLEKLFKAHDWKKEYMGVLAMGWALISPFGGILKWRPHIWISGRRGTGKTHIIENLISPLGGEFAHRGSGKDSEAGIRRELDTDARQVILDEMEPKSAKAREKIGAILELARNASSDGSGVITIAAQDGGTVTFVIRSCFCFASVQIPDEDAAVSSRIISMELKNSDNQAEKFRRCGKLSALCLSDPAKYRRRIYRALPRILSDIEWIRQRFLEEFGDQRKLDQVAPLLASAWAAQSDLLIQQSKEGQRWLLDILSKMLGTEPEGVEDEDGVIFAIIGAMVRTDENNTRAISELMISANDMAIPENGEILNRYGIRFLDSARGKLIAISLNSQHIRGFLKNTHYEAGYGALLKRNALTVEESRPVSFASGRSRACLMDWEKFKKHYIGIDQEELEF